MPYTNEEIRNDHIISILSSTKEELNQLSDAELSVIASILRYRTAVASIGNAEPSPAANINIRLLTIRDLLYSVHYLIMEEESIILNKISNKDITPKKEKKQTVKGKPDLKIVK